MEEVFLRFGHIGDQIFEELDSQTVSKCTFVGKSWKLFLNEGKVQACRIIKTYTNIEEKNLRKHSLARKPRTEKPYWKQELVNVNKI